MPAFEAIQNYLKESGKDLSSNDDIVADSDAKALIQSEIDSAMENFSNYERIKEFSLLPRLLALEKGELTPTLKVVRKVVLENFSDQVDKIYSA